MRFQDALEQLARETQRAKHRLMLERGLRAGLLLLFAVGLWAAIALYGGHEALPLLAQGSGVYYMPDHDPPEGRGPSWAG